MKSGRICSPQLITSQHSPLSEGGLEGPPLSLLCQPNIALHWTNRDPHPHKGCNSPLYLLDVSSKPLIFQLTGILSTQPNNNIPLFLRWLLITPAKLVSVIKAIKVAVIITLITTALISANASRSSLLVSFLPRANLQASSAVCFYADVIFSLKASAKPALMTRGIFDRNSDHVPERPTYTSTVIKQIFQASNEATYDIHSVCLTTSNSYDYRLTEELPEAQARTTPENPDDRAGYHAEPHPSP
ncbi:hypothetical protein J6590_009863 [Homalodisca vitripennis]|nr:hypothetical protein J6590_009863 [Homalodisca vitripennis]